MKGNLLDPKDILVRHSNGNTNINNIKPEPIKKESVKKETAVEPDPIVIDNEDAESTLPDLNSPSVKIIADFAYTRYTDDLITIDGIICSFIMCIKNAVGEFFKERIQDMKITDFEDVYPPTVFGVVEETLVNILTPFSSKENPKVNESVEFIIRYLSEFIKSCGVSIEDNVKAYKNLHATVKYFCKTLENMRLYRNTKYDN